MPPRSIFVYQCHLVLYLDPNLRLDLNLHLEALVLAIFISHLYCYLLPLLSNIGLHIVRLKITQCSKLWWKVVDVVLKSLL